MANTAKLRKQIDAEDQKYRPLDTPPGAKPFADLHTDTAWLKAQKKKTSTSKKKAPAKAKKK